MERTQLTPRIHPLGRILRSNSGLGKHFVVELHEKDLAEKNDFAKRKKRHFEVFEELKEQSTLDSKLDIRKQAEKNMASATALNSLDVEMHQIIDIQNDSP